TAEGVEEQQVRIDLGPLGDTPDKGRAATEAPAAVEFEVGLDTVLPPLGEELGVLTAGRPQELADALGNVRIRTLDRVEGHEVEIAGEPQFALWVVRLPDDLAAGLLADAHRLAELAGQRERHGAVEHEVLTGQQELAIGFIV